MEVGKITAQVSLTEGCAFEVLVRDHHVTLFSVSLACLILGLPLAWNALWHLKVRFSNF